MRCFRFFVYVFDNVFNIYMCVCVVVAFAWDAGIYNNTSVSQIFKSRLNAIPELHKV